MSLFNVSFDDFGGLDLANPVDESSGAIDMLNVDLNVPGRLRARDGYAVYISTSAFVQALAGLPYSGDTSALFASLVGNQVGAYQSGALVGSLSTAGSATYTSFAHIGTPTSESVYAFNAVDAEVKKWNGAAWSTVTIVNGGLACVSPADNRLVVKAGTATWASRVAFSDPGAPETFGTNNSVELQPGVSGAITAMAVWQNYIFVFKRDRYFVFYGTSTDSTGQPVFNYRTVYSTVGPANADAVTVGPNGVYFVDERSGVYVTTGGPAARIPGLDLLFRGQISNTYFTGLANGAATNLTSAVLSYANNRLYLMGNTGTGLSNVVVNFVYDLNGGYWLCWRLDANSMGVYKAVEAYVPGGSSASKVGPVFMAPPGSRVMQGIGVFTPGLATDRGSAISAKYRSGFQSFDWRGRNLRSGIHNVEKIVRESVVDGAGTVSYTLSGGWVTPANLPAGRTLTLGTAPQVKEGRDRTAVKGRAFSYQVSGTAPWSVEKVILALHGYEEAGLKSND